MEQQMILMLRVDGVISGKIGSDALFITPPVKMWTQCFHMHVTQTPHVTFCNRQLRAVMSFEGLIIRGHHTSASYISHILVE